MSMIIKLLIRVFKYPINSENNKVIQSLCTGEKGEFKFFPPDGQYNLRFTVTIIIYFTSLKMK